jgi:hypothetical protein
VKGRRRGVARVLIYLGTKILAYGPLADTQTITPNLTNWINISKIGPRVCIDLDVEKCGSVGRKSHDHFCDSCFSKKMYKMVL